MGEHSIPNPEEIAGTLEYELAKYLREIPEPDYPEIGPGEFVMIVDRETLDRQDAEATVAATAEVEAESEPEA